MPRDLGGIRFRHPSMAYPTAGWYPYSNGYLLGRLREDRRSSRSMVLMLSTAYKCKELGILSADQKPRNGSPWPNKSRGQVRGGAPSDWHTSSSPLLSYFIGLGSWVPGEYCNLIARFVAKLHPRPLPWSWVAYSTAFCS